MGGYPSDQQPTLGASSCFFCCGNSCASLPVIKPSPIPYERACVSRTCLPGDGSTYSSTYLCAKRDRAQDVRCVRDQWRRQEQSRVRDAHAICARMSDHDLGQLRSHHVSAPCLAQKTAPCLPCPENSPLKDFGTFQKNFWACKNPSHSGRICLGTF